MDATPPTHDSAATPWSAVEALLSDNPEVSARALERLTGQYWPAVYAWLRRDRHTPDEAEDLTQGFFADVVIGRQLFTKADSERGRLRSLMRTALRNWVRDGFRRRQARPKMVHINPALFAGEESVLAELPPDQDASFDRRWAMAIFDEALSRCERHYRSIGKTRNWAAFDAWVVGPMLGGRPRPRVETLADGNGFDSPKAVHAAVQTVKLRLRALLEEVIAETVTTQAECEHELTLFRRALGLGM